MNFNFLFIKIYQNDNIFSDRPGLNCDTQVDNLQRELLKSLNLNIMLEHEQKNWNLSPKIRFLEILKLLPGKILRIWTNLSKSTLQYPFCIKLTLTEYLKSLTFFAR